MSRWILILALSAVHVLAWPRPTSAQEWLCDTQYEDCRAPLLDLIRRETLGIDVAFWFMEDARYVQALKDAMRRGVPIRILVDQSANVSHPYNATLLGLLRDAGLPMRDKTGSSILHFKTMLFHGLNVVQFSKANYGAYAFVPATPNVDYHDEAIFFSDDTNLTDSLRRRFDDLWVSPLFQNFANVSGPVERRYPSATIHPSMNFSPLQDFANRAVSRMNAEPQRIDAMAMRITDNRMSDAVLRALARQVPVRLLTDPMEYRDPKRLWHAKHVDKFWYAGAQIKNRKHAGILHQGSIVLYGLGEVIFGSSNWTIASANQQDEHNYFYAPYLQKPWLFQWFVDQFESKWNDTVNYVPFQPQPPGKPAYTSPQNVSSGHSASVTLTWEGGTWAHLYDIYLGTTPNPPLIAANKQLGSPVAGTQESWAVTNLLPGTIYYWRVVGKTWAYLENSGPVWSFTTTGAPPPAGGGPTATLFGGTAASIPGTVQVEDFDVAGQSPASYDTDAGRPGAPYRTTTVDIGPTADASNNGYYVGWTRVGEWLEYTVNVTQTRTYQLLVRVANAGTGAKFRVDVDGAHGPQISVPTTGGWDIWDFTTPISLSLTQGTHKIRLWMVTPNTGSPGVGNFGYLRFD